MRGEGMAVVGGVAVEGGDLAGGGIVWVREWLAVVAVGGWVAVGGEGLAVVGEGKWVAVGGVLAVVGVEGWRWVRQVHEGILLYLLMLLHASFLWQAALQLVAEQTNLSAPRRMSPPHIWQLL